MENDKSSQKSCASEASKNVTPQVSDNISEQERNPETLGMANQGNDVENLSSANQNETGSSSVQEATTVGVSEPASASEDMTTADDEDETNTGAEKKIRKRTGYGRKGQNAPKFEEKEYVRNKVAKERGDSLVHQAWTFKERTGANVYLKAQYTNSKNQVWDYTFGQDFVMRPGGQPHSGPSACTGEEQHDPPISRQEIRQLVTEGVAAGLASQPSPTSTTDEPEETQEGLFNSPSVTSRRTVVAKRRSLSGAGCQQCHRTDEFVLGNQGVLIPAQWFECGAPGCRAKSRNECLGFPGTSYEEIKKFCNWYCMAHIGMGRPPIVSDELPTSVAASASTVGPTGVDGEPLDGGRGARRGRGSRGGGRGGTSADSDAGNGNPRGGRGSRGGRGGRGSRGGKP